MATSKALVTAENLLSISAKGKFTGKRYELVEGELIEMAPTGARHGRLSSKFAQVIGNFVDQRGLGEAFGAETGFRIGREPDTVRAPDAAFVRKDRLPQGGLPEGYLELAPDLAVEVVSPGDTAREVQAKVEAWLKAGVVLVWVAYPNTQSIAVYRGLDNVRVLSLGDTLTGEPVLPGFSFSLNDLF